MSLQESELFYKLNCVRCGTKNESLCRYKRRIPVCLECKKRFSIRKYSRNLLLFFSIIFFILLVVSILFSIPLLSEYRDDPKTIRTYTPIVIMSLISTSIFAVLIVISIIISKKFGTNLKDYFKNVNQVFSVRPETSTDWYLYQDWIRRNLQEKNISDNEISTFIESEFTLQKTLTERNMKRGKTITKSGGFIILLGVVTIIFGIVGPLLAELSGQSALALIAIQMTYSVPLFVFGIIFVVYGRGLKKF